MKICILTAGKGTRMNSELPKVLHLLRKKPLLSHVIDTSKKLSPFKIIVVVGYKKELIINQFNDDNVVFVEQKKLMGTADAIKNCLPSLQNFDGDVLILSGDVPMIKVDTLMNFFSHHNKNKALGYLKEDLRLLSFFINNKSFLKSLIKTPVGVTTKKNIKPITIGATIDPNNTPTLNHSKFKGVKNLELIDPKNKKIKAIQIGKIFT